MTDHAREVQHGERFGFGLNWTRFLSVLNEERIDEARSSLRRMLHLDSLRELTFLDVGSGSGLFSLAARSLGARVHSFDYDPQSVACTAELKRQYFAADQDWVVESGSVLDPRYLSRLGQFDVVYSWGVLHHTGQMWVAIENVVPLVKPGGRLFIAIYNKQPFLSGYWTFVKRQYNRSWPAVQRGLDYAFFTFFAAALCGADVARGRHPARRYRGTDDRGMSLYYDVVDWIGGWPFEVATPEECFRALRKHEFELIELVTCGGNHGCNEFVFVKRPQLGGVEATARQPPPPPLVSRAPRKAPDVKIVLLARSLGLGGTERQVVMLARGFQQRGCDVSVAVFYSGGLLEKELHDHGIPVWDLQKGGRWDVSGFIVRLIRMAQHLAPDVICGFLAPPNMATVLLKPLFPRIQMVWGVRASNVDLARYDWLSRVSYRMECLLSRFADRIICNSQAGLDYAAAHGFPEETMTVVPNGIDVELFKPDSAGRQQIRGGWGIGDGDVLIGVIGRLDAMKDHPTFLRAAAMLAREREGVRFVCVGEGTAAYTAELRRLASELGLAERLTWAGARLDMTGVCNAMDVVVSSSYGEGFPNVVAEAMACGVPCVVTDVGDSAMIVGTTGVVVEPARPDALCQGLRSMIERLGPELRHDVRQSIVSRFTNGMLVTRTLEVLNGLGQRKA